MNHEIGQPQQCINVVYTVNQYVKKYYVAVPNSSWAPFRFE